MTSKKTDSELIDSIVSRDDCLDFVEALAAEPAAHFPSGKTPYSTQVDAMEALKDFLGADDERLMIIQMPTAGGKSPLAAAATKSWVAAGGKSAIICPNKELQWQYRSDFGASDLSVVVGGVEFQCVENKGMSCGHAKARKSCPLRKGRHGKNRDESAPSDDDFCDDLEDGSGSTRSKCPYKGHLVDAATQSSKKPYCFTPHSFMAFRRNPSPSAFLPSGNGLLVVDEAHLLPDQLRDFISISIPLDLIEKTLECDPNSGGFVAEFFSGAQARNGEGHPVAVLRDHQAMYLDAIAEVLRKRAENVEKAQKAQDYVSLYELISGDLGSQDPDSIAEYAENLAAVARKITQVTVTMGETNWLAEISTGNDRDDLSKIDAGKPQIVGGFGRSATIKANTAVGDATSPTATAAKNQSLRLLLRPIIIPKSFLRSFFGGFSKIVLMSGTFFPIHMRMLGLATGDGDSWAGARVFEVGSRIPAERRRMTLDVVNGMGVNNGNLEETFSWFSKYLIETVLPRVPSIKGMIHVSSHVQAELLAGKLNIDSIRWAKRTGRPKPAVFITPKLLGWRETYRGFKETVVSSGAPSVILIAARRYEGIDLRDNYARLNVVAKVPYPALGDSMVQALEMVFPGYKDIVTVVALLQAMARAVRHPGDWALNICLDTSARGLLKRLEKILPAYIKEAVPQAQTSDWVTVWTPPTSSDQPAEEVVAESSSIEDDFEGS